MRSRDFGGLAGDLAGGSGGQDDGRPPVVLLHGLTFDRAMWGPALAELRKTDARRRVLALDLPGHGDSPAWPRYGADSLAGAVHEAVTRAGIAAPVLVGHSISAVITAAYAARHPVAGLVNVDQQLRMEPAAAMARSLADEIRGDGFAGAWARVEASMHMDMLPASARELLRATCQARQDLVTGYWRELFDIPGPELAGTMARALDAVREAGVPYLFIAGREVEAEYRDWLGTMLPGAQVEAWLGSGHFPHLAHPGRFAGRLAATAEWGGAV